jgi:hypothetical protein
MLFRTPWDSDPAPTETGEAAGAPPEILSLPKRRGRRPAPMVPSTKPGASPDWLYHHLTIGGPAPSVSAFAKTARGSGVIPWQLDLDRVEEDIFNIAVAQPRERRTLTIEGCRILARQFRDRVAARQARAAALVGTSRACPLDLQALLPVPDCILQLGPTDPASLAWLSENWGVTSGLRHVVERDRPTMGRLPSGHAAVGYGFFTTGTTPHAAIMRLGGRWAELRFELRPRPPG